MKRKPEISWADFEKIDMRIGTITEARNFEKAHKPALKLWVDFGPLGVLKTSARITDHYAPDELTGKQVCAIVNFPPKQIADFMSECLVMGIYTPDGVVLLDREREVKNGSRVG